MPANLNRGFAPTLPLDGADPFRFGQLHETAKDCFQREIKNFFTLLSSRFTERKQLVPTVEKYASGTGHTDLESVVTVLLQRPDRLEHLPLIIVTSATGGQEQLTLGSQYCDTVRLPARVVAPTVGPYNLVSGDRLAFRTFPSGPKKPPLVSTLTFNAGLFQDITAVTADDVINLANSCLLYMTVDKRAHTDPIGQLRFFAGGKLTSVYPNSIEVLPPPFSTVHALQAFGFYPSPVPPVPLPLPKQSSTAYPPALRYQMAKSLTINLDIGAEDENQRRELTDLVDYWLQLDMDERGKVFYGRSPFDIDFAPPENFQVILLDKGNVTAEVEVPRTASSGEQKDLIYACRMSIPVKVIDYVDQVIGAPYAETLSPIRQRTASDILPEGDYAAVHSGFLKTSG